MKRYFCLIFTIIFILLFTTFPVFSENGYLTVVPSKYANDAFCFSFERESDFNNPDLPFANTFENIAPNKRYSPGAGGSNYALHVRTEVQNYSNGIISNGVKNLTLTVGQTYKISAWIKLLHADILARVPNLNFFFMNNGTPLYEDEACTIPIEDVGGKYHLIKILGADIKNGYEANGSVSGDWLKAETTFTMPSKIVSGKNTYYLKPDSTFQCKLFLRLGANEHTITTKEDYTEEYIASITNDDGTLNTNAMYCDYAIDDFTLTPYVAPAGVVQDAPLVHHNMEENMWYTGNSPRFSSVAATAEWAQDTAPQVNGKRAISLTYNGNNNHYMEYSVTLDKNHSIIHNRAYKITFYAKASEALVHHLNNAGSVFTLIPERAYNDRLERTKNKWHDTKMPIKFTEEYQKYEILWYEPNQNMLGRTTENNTQVRFDLRITGLPSLSDEKTEAINGTNITYAYNYEGKNGTVYASLKDFKVWFDDITIEPMDIVFGGNMTKDTERYSTWDSTGYTPNTNPNLTNTFGAGTVISDNGNDVLFVSAINNRPTQGVEIENGACYKISYRAKAANAESAGKHLTPMLDRSIKGAVLDNAVTTQNPNGILGYGNPTGETGDIPYYMYQGTQTHHPDYKTFTVNQGETVVYDDYFARLKAGSAYNYQIFNGTEWVNQNEDTLPAITTEQALSENWQSYTINYQWCYEGDHYRLPRLTFLTDGADYLIDDIKIERVNHFTNNIAAENLTAPVQSHYYAGNPLQLSYDYVSTSEEGMSVLKLYAGINGNYAVNNMYYIKSGTTTLPLPGDLYGTAPGLQIIPYTKDNVVGAAADLWLSGTVAERVHTNLIVTDTAVSCEIDTGNAEGLLCCLALYDDKNALLSTTYTPLNNETYTKTVEKGTAKKAKLMVLEQQNFAPVTNAKTAILCPKNTQPFEGKSTITAAFLGGSNAAGTAHTYPYLTEEYLKETYPEKEIRIINLAKDSATSNEGVTQAEYAAAQSPDIVFFDFNVNDNGANTSNNFHTMIHTLSSETNTPYMILINSGNSTHNDFSRYTAQIAEQYHLPQIDLAQALYHHLSGDDAKDAGYFSDFTHPTKEAHVVYATAIVNALKTGMYYTRPQK